MLAGAEDLRDAFQNSLNSAIAHGLRPSRWIGLGEQTFDAIEVIADEHPDASAGRIADAYDAFDREHCPHADANRPRRLVARRGRFTRGRALEPDFSAADRAPNLAEDQEDHADDEHDPPDRRDDGWYGQQITHKDEDHTENDHG